LHRIIDTLQKTVDKVFVWVSRTFSGKDKEELKTDFEYDTGRRLDPYEQTQKSVRQKEHGMER